MHISTYNNNRAFVLPILLRNSLSCIIIIMYSKDSAHTFNYKISKIFYFTFNPFEIPFDNKKKILEQKHDRLYYYYVTYT